MLACHMVVWSQMCFPAGRQGFSIARSSKAAAVSGAKQRLLTVCIFMWVWAVTHLISVMVVVPGNAGWLCEGVLPADVVWPLCGPGVGSRYPPPHQVILPSCSSFSCAVLQIG